MTLVNEMTKEFASNEYEVSYIENLNGGSLEAVNELYEDGVLESFNDIQIQAYIHVLHSMDFETELLLKDVNSKIRYIPIHFKNDGNPIFENKNGEAILNLELPQENYISMLLVNTFNEFIEMIIDNNVADKVNYSIV